MKDSDEKSTIVVVGGDDRVHGINFGPGVTVRTFASPRYAGNGSTHRAFETIGRGAIDVVVLLVRWLGHPESRALIAACKSANIPVLTIAGGFSKAQRDVREFLASRGPHAAERSPEGTAALEGGSRLPLGPAVPMPPTHRVDHERVGAV